METPPKFPTPSNFLISPRGLLLPPVHVLFPPPPRLVVHQRAWLRWLPAPCARLLVHNIIRLYFFLHTQRMTGNKKSRYTFLNWELRNLSFRVDQKMFTLYVSWCLLPLRWASLASVSLNLHSHSLHSNPITLPASLFTSSTYSSPDRNEMEIRKNNATVTQTSPFQSLFSTRRICSREQSEKQFHWLATNTDDITTQSHSLFACSREKKSSPSGKRNAVSSDSLNQFIYPPPWKSGEIRSSLETASIIGRIHGLIAAGKGHAYDTAYG